MCSHLFVDVLSTKVVISIRNPKRTKTNSFIDLSFCMVSTCPKLMNWPVINNFSDPKMRFQRNKHDKKHRDILAGDESAWYELTMTNNYILNFSTIIRFNRAIVDPWMFFFGLLCKHTTSPFLQTPPVFVQGINSKVEFNIFAQGPPAGNCW